MLAALTLALALQAVSVKVGGGDKSRADSIRRAAVRDSIRIEMISRVDDDRRRPARRIPVTPELARTAFRDTAARTLKVKAMIQANGAPGYDLWAQRSLQIGAQVYYLSQGKLSGWDW